MSRKDYILLAKALRLTRPNPLREALREQWVRMRDELCTQLTNDNPRFDTVRFIDATETD